MITLAGPLEGIFSIFSVCRGSFQCKQPSRCHTITTAAMSDDAHNHLMAFFFLRIRSYYPASVAESRTWGHVRPSYPRTCLIRPGCLSRVRHGASSSPRRTHTNAFRRKRVSHDGISSLPWTQTTATFEWPDWMMLIRVTYDAHGHGLIIIPSGVFPGTQPADEVYFLLSI